MPQRSLIARVILGHRMDVERLEEFLRGQRLQWLGHAERMDEGIK